MIETALLVYLLLMWSGLPVVHGTSDDRDFFLTSRSRHHLFSIFARHAAYI